ncbi:hypothetical protein JKA74_18545 [Marivirga sp. S37H4]|uniref:Rieske domain-containing protein n=1 Tax=Marivirga aurantiaca TaxID=2802615 RepID=A0A934X230_9BACT|nr:hypothetical protein [Marivirga aurantiaca]MBK6267051.1 hypothetical protein [Marivirga aurantiaca]
MNIKKYITLVLLSAFALFSSCKDENADALIDELPLPAPFEEYLNLTLVSNQSLQFDNHLYLNDVGLRGIVVVKRGDNDYAAFERTCPYKPELDCSLISHVNLGTSGSYLECGCDEETSFYNDQGFPTSGPSPKRLRQYRTQLSGNTLIIDDTII